MCIPVQVPYHGVSCLTFSSTKRQPVYHLPYFLYMHASFATTGTALLTESLVCMLKTRQALKVAVSHTVARAVSCPCNLEQPNAMVQKVSASMSAIP